MKRKSKAWETLSIARNPKRRTSLDYINLIFDEFIELHGDRCFKDDKAIVCGLARINHSYYTVIAQQKGRTTLENMQRNFGMPNPESYRKAIRFMKQAEKFKRPVITFIDTKGAYPVIEAEQRGQGEAIAKSMMTLSSLEVPVIAFVIGEAFSGGALALGVANKVYMLENAIYSVISPEGFASIVFKDAHKAKDAVEKMKITAKDLYDLKIIDKIVKESDDDSYAKVALKMKDLILKSTLEYKKKSALEITEERYQKFRKMGEYDNVKEKENFNYRN